MRHEFSPWRSEYYEASRTKKDGGCVFCEIIKNQQNDEDNFVLFRAKECFALMNRYPYTLGEFMILPYSHADALDKISSECWMQMSLLVREGVKILKTTLSADGVNIGMNLGAAAGAGISEHIHYHLVPRWHKDTNFITTISYTRIHGAPFIEQYEILKRAWATHSY